jgi:hypothetical protein
MPIFTPETGPHVTLKKFWLRRSVEIYLTFRGYISLYCSSIHVVINTNILWEI